MGFTGICPKKDNNFIWSKLYLHLSSWRGKTFVENLIWYINHEHIYLESRPCQLVIAMNPTGYLLTKIITRDTQINRFENLSLGTGLLFTFHPSFSSSIS